MPQTLILVSDFNSVSSLDDEVQQLASLHRNTTPVVLDIERAPEGLEKLVQSHDVVVRYFQASPMFTFISALRICETNSSYRPRAYSLSPSPSNISNNFYVYLNLLYFETALALSDNSVVRLLRIDPMVSGSNPPSARLSIKP